MSCNCWNNIWYNLTLYALTTDKSNQWHPISDFIDAINTLIWSVYYPSYVFCVDEST